MSDPSELRDKLLLSYGIGHGYTPQQLEEIYGDRVDYAMDAVIASLPSLQTYLLHWDSKDKLVMLEDVRQLLQSAKSTSKDSE